MLFECFPCARKKVLEHLFKVWYIINIETEERKTKTMKTLEKIKKLEKTSKTAYRAGNKMFGKKMQALRTRWVALKEQAVIEGISKKTSEGEAEYDGYNFGDVCA